MTGEVAFALAGQTVNRIKISDIVIRERQRKIDIMDKNWVEHIDKLAASIKRAGLIHPITLEDESNVLIAGFNRIQAFLKLGHTEIPYVRRSELTDLDRRVLELEENLQRLDLKWFERDAAIATIDKIQRELAEARGETWTTAKTAEAVGVSVGTVSQAKQITEAIEKKPELKNVGGLVAALNVLKTDKIMERRKELVAKKSEGKIQSFPAEIFVGDARHLIKEVPDESIDAVITNLPFGIELTIGKDQKKPYEDEEDYIIDLVREVIGECYRVLKPDSWFVGFFDIRKITYSNKQLRLFHEFHNLISQAITRGDLKEEEVAELFKLAEDAMGLAYWLEKAGFDYVQLLPCIWAKPNKRQGMIGDPNKGMIMSYEAFVFAGKGTPILMKKGRQNLFIYDTPLGNDRDIDVQMSAEICAELCQMVALGGAKILDPFAGSGAAGEGALSCQMEFLGFELDPKRAEVGNLRLREHLYAREKANVKPE